MSSPGGNPPSGSEDSTGAPQREASLPKDSEAPCAAVAGAERLRKKEKGPERLALREQPRAVTRLNRRTLAVLAAVLGACVLIAMLWGQRKSPPRGGGAAGPGEHAVTRVVKAEGLDTLPHDYTGVAHSAAHSPLRLGAPIGELGRPVLREEHGAGLQPLPERPTFSPSPEEDALRAERLRRERETQNAAQGQVFVQLKEHSRSASHDRSAPPDSAEAPSNSAILASTPTPASASAHAPPSAQERKENFLNGSALHGDSHIYGSGTLQTPRSGAQLMAGTIIPAALISGINSDLPGQILATVTSPVYDTVTGRLLLIPQGARLLGQYDSQVAYGQERVLLVWTRLIMPNGTSILLDRLPGVDTTGAAGLQDRVDWHMDRVATGAALSTVLGVAAQLATPSGVALNGSNGGVLVIATKQSLQDTVNQVGQEITRRNLDVQPTLRIRPGFPLRIIVNKDLVLRPYGS